MIKPPYLYAAGGVAAILVLGVAVQAALGGGRVSTDDAYVAADISLVAPKISGLVDRVEVEDNQEVTQGTELVHLDDRDERAGLAAAQAQLQAAQASAAQAAATVARQASIIGAAQATLQSDAAALAFAQANAARYRNLADGGAGTVEQQQQASTQLRQAQAAQARDQAALQTAQADLPVLQAASAAQTAAVARAQAALDQARLTLSYTSITAPVAGMVGARGVRVGNYVQAGSTLLAVVPLQKAYVLANFRETQLAAVKPGQPVRIHVDALPDVTLNGHVASLAPASGITFSPIAADNATGNFTKVVQRLPLKIWLDPGQPALARLRVGMSVEAGVDVSR